MKELDDLEPFHMAHFFHLEYKIKRMDSLPEKKRYSSPYLLPDFTDFLEEESFADIAMTASEEGLFIGCMVHQAFEDVAFPQVTMGDSLEIFIDTRDLKSSKIIHKFCHHFVFFPKSVADCQGLEKTQFRGDDAHELAESSLLEVDTVFHQKCYEMSIMIPAAALYGYDLSRMNKLGFTYRLNRKKGPSMHFNVSSLDYQIEKHPSLWATLVVE